MLVVVLAGTIPTYGFACIVHEHKTVKQELLYNLFAVSLDANKFLWATMHCSLS